MVLNGVDVASWQAGIDFSKVPGDFAIIKATGGTRYINPECDRQYQSAKRAGKLLGVYHYANEEYCKGTAEQEAQFFLDNIKGYIGEAILVLDWEASNKHDVGWAKRWLDYVYAKTGIKPLFYTYTAVLNAYNFSSIAAADYGLWVANYGTNANESGYRQPNPPASPYWKSIAMFQYSSNTLLPGWGARIDVNVFYGDRNAWAKYARKQGSVSPENPKPATSDPTAAGAHNPIKKDGTNSQGHLDRFGENKKGNLWVNGWQADTKGYDLGFVFIMDANTKKELARKMTGGIIREDVNKDLKLPKGLKYGIDVNFDISAFKGKKIYVMFRRTNDKKGDTAGGHTDIHFQEWYLTL